MITDSSGSIDNLDWEKILRYMSDIVNSFDIVGEDGLKVATLSFLIKYLLGVT